MKRLFDYPLHPLVSKTEVIRMYPAELACLGLHVLMTFPPPHPGPTVHFSSLKTFLGPEPRAYIRVH